MVSERVQRQIDRLLDEPENGLAKFDWQVVQKCAEAVIRLDPENRDAHIYLEAAQREPGIGGASDNVSDIAPTQNIYPGLPCPAVRLGQL